jgi:probable addiction module antidote protein
MAKSKSYNDSLLEALRDPAEAAAYLNAALEEGDQAALLLALRNVIDAQSSMTRIAEETSLNRESLYKALSENGNPRLKSLNAILRAVGLKLGVRVE